MIYKPLIYHNTTTFTSYFLIMIPNTRRKPKLVMEINISHIQVKQPLHTNAIHN